jgi:hypothetical protein
VSVRKTIVAVLGAGVVITTGSAAAGAAAASGAHHQPVVGSKRMFHGYGRGWGTVKPRTLADGTDCGSVISHIHWHSWGGATAHGTGKTCPHESRSRKLVKIKLLPTAIGMCPGTDRRAYTKFDVRLPKKHGGFGHKKPWLGIKNYCG